MSFRVKVVLWAALFGTKLIAASVFTFQPIEPCPACGSQVSGINNSGEIAGSAYDSQGGHAFVGSGGSFTVFDEPDAFFTEAVGLNNAGRVTVNYFLPNATGRAYILEPNGAKTFLPVVAGANYTLGGNVNDLGVAVGFYGNNLDGSTTVNAYIDLGTTVAYTFAYPGAVITQALGINDAGIAVGEYLTSTSLPPHGFIRLLDGTLQAFDVPGSIGTEIFDIDNSGNMAGDYIDAAGTKHGFAYRNGVLNTLDFGVNTTVFAINDLGQATGASYPNGGFFTGPYSGFVATPSPEPNTLCFMFLGLIGGTCVIRRRSVEGCPSVASPRVCGNARTEPIPEPPLSS